MAISLHDLKKVRATLPPRIILYGVQGVGKTSLAYEAPNPVFIQTEDGTPGGEDVNGNPVELATFGHLTNYDSVIEAFQVLATEDHGFKTVVIDTLDAMEPLVWQKTCDVNGWQSIEDPGYGKGYAEADVHWRNFIDACNYLRREKGMTIIKIAHCHTERVDDPVHGPYSKFSLNLHKRGSNLVRNEADMIGFMNYALSVKTTDEGFNKESRRAEGGNSRLIYWEERAGFVAKNRYGLPASMIYKKGQTWPKLQDKLPAFSLDTQPEAEPETEEAPAE